MGLIKKEQYKQDIDEGLEVFTKPFNIAWLLHYTHEAQKLFKKNNEKKLLVLILEPKNQLDKKAIAIVVRKKGLIFNKDIKVGYLPPDLAHFLHKHKLHKKEIGVRLREIWWYDTGALYVSVDLYCKVGLINKSLKGKLKKIETKFGYGEAE